MVKPLPANAGDTRDVELGSSWVGKILWSRKWQPTPVFLPGKFHAQRSLAGHSLWVVKESDLTERLNTHIQTLMTSHYLCCHHPGPSHHHQSCLGYSNSFLPGLPASVFCHFYIQSQPNSRWCQCLLRLFLNALHFTQCKNHIFTAAYAGWKSPFTSLAPLSPATLALGCQASLTSGHLHWLSPLSGILLPQIDVWICALPFPGLCSNITLTKPDHSAQNSNTSSPYLVLFSSREFITF